jgi:hypothetical protein
MVLKKLTQLETPVTKKPLSNLSALDTDPVKPLDQPESQEMKPVVYVVFVILIVFGVLTGFVLSRNQSSSANKPGNTITQTSSDKKTVGVSDTQTFKDSATGVIEMGGADNEGTHKLIRDGGPSQTVYLISSVVDLDQFAGQKVTVWGQTMGAQNVAWLMDVGKVEMQ